MDGNVLGEKQAVLVRCISFLHGLSELYEFQTFGHMLAWSGVSILYLLM